VSVGSAAVFGYWTNVSRGVEERRRRRGVVLE